VTNNATSTVSVPGYITIAIGPDDVVTLRGLNIDGGGYGSPGIRFGDSSASSGTLVLDNVTITGYGGSGILFAPTGPSRLIVTNSLLSRNGSGTTGAAIRVLPQSGASAFVSITKSVIVANIYGLAIDTTAGGAGINVLISDSEVSANKLDGIITVANPGPIGVTADLTRLADNGQFGIRSYGAASTIRAGRSTITGNGTGVVSQNGGKMLTYGSNFLEGNGTKGTFTGALTSE
jgi:hypothetical protein